METPDPPDTPSPYMSPKLREKLEQESRGGGRDSTHEQAPAWMGPAVLGLLVLAVVGVAIGVMRSNTEKKRLAVIAHADSVRAAAAADSAAAVLRDSLRADSIRTAANPKPSPKPAATPAPSTASRTSTPASGGAATATAAAPAAPARKYGLIVGEYIDETKANEVKDQLTSSTSLPGRVISVDNGNAFRVIIGSFDGKAAAEKAAGELSAKGQVNEARVTALPK